MDAKEIAALFIEIAQPYYTLAQAQLEAQLLTARQLERIATALEDAMTPPVAPPAPVECEHPAEARIDFGITDGVEDWQCRLCGYRTTAEPKVS